MGNVGGIEKILVGCILVIILAILGIAVSSTNEPSEPAYQKIASKPERTQDPAHRAKKSDGSPPLMSNPKVNEAKTDANPSDGIAPRFVHNPVKVENGAPVDVTDRVPAPTPPANANEGSKAVPANADKGEPESSTTKQAPPTAPPEPKAAPGPKFHVVVKGDTVEKIAVQYFDDRRMAAEILKLNEDLEPTRLFEGRKVLLPDAGIKDWRADDAKSNAAPATPSKKSEEPVPAVTDGKYRVKKGDTILSICREHYGSVARWQEILKANGMKEGRELRVGMELTLP